MIESKVVLLVTVSTVYLLNIILTTGQYPYADCNHFWDEWPLDVCIPHAQSYDYMYVCNGTTSIILNQYHHDECGTPGAVPIYSESYYLPKWGTCDKDTNCDYFFIQCDGISMYYATINTCLNGYIDTCSDTKVTRTKYKFDDCSGKIKQETTNDWADFGDDYGYSDCKISCPIQNKNNKHSKNKTDKISELLSNNAILILCTALVLFFMSIFVLYCYKKNVRIRKNINNMVQHYNNDKKDKIMSNSDLEIENSGEVGEVASSKNATTVDENNVEKELLNA